MTTPHMAYIMLCLSEGRPYSMGSRESSQAAKAVLAKAEAKKKRAALDEARKVDCNALHHDNAFNGRLGQRKTDPVLFRIPDCVVFAKEGGR